MLCFLFSVVAGVTLAFTIEGHGLHKDSDIKVVDCKEKIAGMETARVFLEFERYCEAYDVHFQLENTTSILSFKIAIEYLGSPTQQNPNQTVGETGENVLHTALRGFDSEKRAAAVDFYEQTVYEDSKTDSILLATWNVQDVSENHTRNKGSYLSRTSDVNVRVAVKGDWKNFRIVFFYEEIKYDELEENHSGISGDIKSGNVFEGQYRPNTVVLHRLREEPLSKSNGILLIFDQFDIDASVGEYILIGAGTQPFEGPKPLFVSKIQPNSTYYVDDSSAYIMFVSSSRQTRRSGFRIRWEHTGTRTLDEDDTSENPLDALKSREICFYNVSSEECQNPRNQNGLFDRFRDLFLEMVKGYADEKKISYTDTFKSLNASSVVLHGVENCLNRFPLQAIIQVKYQGKSLLTWQQLGDVINSFETIYSDFSVGHCPQKLAYDHKEWSFVIYLCVPTFAVFFLILWAWKQNVFKESCKSQNGDKELGVRQPCMNAEPNLYEGASPNTIPKLLETNELGRKRTLVAQNSAPAKLDGNRNETNIVDMTTMPSTSDESGSGRHISLTRSKRRPSIQPLIERNEKINQQSHIHKIQMHEKEHLYHSVGSNVSVKDTKL